MLFIIISPFSSNLQIKRLELLINFANSIIAENNITIKNTKNNPLHIYESYSSGPLAATLLLEKEGATWFEDTVLGELEDES